LKKKVNCKPLFNLTKKLIILTIIISIIAFNTWYYNNTISPLIMNYAENRIQELSSNIITNSLNNHLLSNLKTEDLFIITRDNNQIKTIDFNSVVINKVIIDALVIIKKTLNESTNSKVEKVSIGSLLNNVFLTNKGPKIKITYQTTNDLNANLNNKITSYGINNAIIETFINIDLTFNIVIPMSTKKIKSNLSIPLSLKIIEGQVPEYYLNGYNENSPILSLPSS